MEPLLSMMSEIYGRNGDRVKSASEQQRKDQPPVFILDQGEIRVCIESQDYAGIADLPAGRVPLRHEERLELAFDHIPIRKNAPVGADPGHLDESTGPELNEKATFPSPPSAPLDPLSRKNLKGR